MSMKDVSSIAADVSGRDVSNAVEVLRVMDAVRLAQVLLCVTPTQHGADMLSELAEPLRGRVVAAMGPVAACKLVAEMELKVALDVMLSLPVRVLGFQRRRRPVDLESRTRARSPWPCRLTRAYGVTD